MYTMASIARTCKVAKSSVWKWVAEGFLPPPDTIIGKRKVWFGDTLRAWAKEKNIAAIF